MGRFVNPDAGAFRTAINFDMYVDKTAMIDELNNRLDFSSVFVCVSRPRRFGRSTIANMLTAYYSKGATGSAQLFQSFYVSGRPKYKVYLNDFNVIHIDMLWMILRSAQHTDSLHEMVEDIITELRDEYPFIPAKNDMCLSEILALVYRETGKKFAVIIDEWDIVIRDYEYEIDLQKDYLDFLSDLFSNSNIEEYIALTYLTGIYPISQTKVADRLARFVDSSVFAAGEFAPYVGFIKKDVEILCDKFNGNIDEIEKWYGGYHWGNEQIFNPSAVVKALRNKFLSSYWSQTCSDGVVTDLLNDNVDGARKAFEDLIEGHVIPVEFTEKSDFTSRMQSVNDVLLYMVMLGYLSYDSNARVVAIPNKDVRQCFCGAVAYRKAIKK